MRLTRAPSLVLVLTVAAGAPSDSVARDLGKRVRDNGVTMNSSAQRRVAEVIRLPDDAYFSLDESRRMDLEDKVAGVCGDEGFDSPPLEPAASLPFLVALGLPRSVDLGRIGSVPALLATRQTGLREWEVHSRQNTIFVQRDLNRGEVRLGWPLVKGKRMRTPDPSRSGPPLDSVNAQSKSAGVQRIDLLEAGLVDRRSARVAVTAIVYDQASNT